MGDITPVLIIDYKSLIISIFTVIIGLKAAITSFEWFMNKFGIETKWMREKREKNDLLIKTAQDLELLQQKHRIDINQSNEYLIKFIDEMRDYILKAQNEQKTLTESIMSISRNENERTQQIEALMRGSKELLGAEIDKRYRDYISLDGIPESDVSEFDDIFTAYKGLNGNHSCDLKYNYVKNHLKVIPVEQRLMI
jgi:hypothetical protein